MSEFYWLIGPNWGFALVGVALYELLRILMKGFRVAVLSIGWRYYVIIFVLCGLAIFVCRISGDVSWPLAVWIGASVPSTLGILFASSARGQRELQAENSDDTDVIRVDDIRLSLVPNKFGIWSRALSTYFLNLHY